MPSQTTYSAHVQRLLGEIFAELGEFTVRLETRRDGSRSDIAVVCRTLGTSYHFDINYRERLTPQIADELFVRLRNDPAPSGQVRVVYAPVISPRVAEIARRRGISHLDFAGNCRIVDPSSGLAIIRSGILNPASSREQTIADPFSPKSSRIVRLMLHEPARGWHVTELAEHPDVRVSVGLASKVKQALLRENYALVRDRLLYLNQPADVLEAWTRNYSGPAVQRNFYVRGELPEVEGRVSAWCEQANIEYALARFSAAWRHAPDVRYAVASLYVGADAFQDRALESLQSQCGTREVDTGANLVLLTPFDESVFVRRTPTPEQTSSPLQTYLDLRSLAGRGDEAAEAVFERHLRPTLESAGDRTGSRQ